MWRGLIQGGALMLVLGRKLGERIVVPPPSGSYGPTIVGFEGPEREASLRRAEEVSPLIGSVVAALAG
jgi:hypothetical protein